MNPNKHTYRLGPQAQRLCRENRPTATELASGVSVYAFRYYSPALGRFVNRDPVGERGGVNLYAFVGNSMVNAIDFLGLFDAWPAFHGPTRPAIPGAVSASLVHYRAQTRTVGPKTGFSTALDRLGSVVRHVRSWKTRRDGDGGSTSKLFGRISVEYSTNEFSVTNIHELVHVYNIVNRTGIKFASREDEGMGYGMEAVADANIALQEIAWTLHNGGGASCESLASDVKSQWYSLWLKHSSPSQKQIASGHTGTLNARDFESIERHLGARISCRKFANILNSLSPKECCLRFTCRNSGWIENSFWEGKSFKEIPAGRSIDEVFR